MRKLLPILALMVAASWLQAADPALVQASAFHSHTSSGTTIDVTYGTTPTVGNMLTLVVVGNQGSDFTVSGCTDNQSTANTYTIRAHKEGSGGISGYTVAILTAPVVTSTGTFTVTCTASASSYLTLIPFEWSGVSSTPDLDGTANIEKAADAPDYITCYASTGIATTNAKDVILSGLSQVRGNPIGITVGATGDTYVMPTNSVQQNSSCCGGGAAEYLITSATGTYTPTFGLGDTYQPAVCSSIVMKGEAAASGVRRRVVISQ